MRDSDSRPVHLLCSYPKCGRTWLRLVLTGYFTELNRYPHAVDYRSMFRMFPNNDRDPVRGVGGYAFAGDQRLPLLLFDHSPSQRIPNGTHLIFLLRGALDCLVSNYFQLRHRLGAYHGSIDEFVLRHQLGISGWVAYLNGWAEHLPRCPHRLISYEAMHADMASVTAEVLRFLGVAVEAEALARAIDGAQFQRMQAIERRDGFPGQAEADPNRSAEALRARVGKVGGYVDHLHSDCLHLLRDYARRRLSSSAKQLLQAQALTGDLGL